MSTVNPFDHILTPFPVRDRRQPVLGAICLLEKVSPFSLSTEMSTGVTRPHPFKQGNPSGRNVRLIPAFIRVLVSTSFPGAYIDNHGA